MDEDLVVGWGLGRRLSVPHATPAGPAQLVTGHGVSLCQLPVRIPTDPVITWDDPGRREGCGRCADVVAQIREMDDVDHIDELAGTGEADGDGGEGERQGATLSNRRIGGHGGAPAAEATGLYERFGGDLAVRRAGELLNDYALRDPELRPYFQDLGRSRARQHQATVLAHLLDQERDSGRTLHEAHRGLVISEHDYRGFVVHLVLTLHEVHVPADVIARLEQVLEQIKPHVLAAPDA